jgi:monothiol glutaredoxin
MNIMKNLKQQNHLFKFTFNRKNFSDTKIFFKSFISTSKPRFSYLKSLKNFSTSNSNDAKQDEIHSDFKPKIKQEINDENVLRLIDEWVKGNDVTLFMKGTREMPRCGFSNFVVQILNFYKIKKVKVINILESPLLRESVKQYSNWPTFPQLYVKGNLVGGCDIIKEMHENGTFKELVEREVLQSSE